MKNQRWVILISFIIAAVLTPTPDPFNQLIMAVPLILLYQASVVLLLFINKNER
jgi:sec-independent protein translocase protein TatC